MNEEVADIKPPIDLPFDWTPVWWVAGVIVIMCVGLYVWFILRKKKTVLQTQVAVVIPAWEKALAQLQKIHDQDWPRQGRYKDFVDGVGDVIRVYCEERFHINAPHMSSEEFLHFMQRTQVLDAELKVSVERMLMLGDMVKFAKHTPTLEDCASFYKQAVQIIEASRGI